MNKLNKILAAAIVFACFTITAKAQSTAYGTTTAVLVTPISIVKTTDMHFGTVAASATAGEVILDYADGRTTSGGVSLPAGSTTQKTAVFTVTGEGTSSFSIAIPTGTVTLARSGGGTLTVDQFACDLGATSTLTAGTKVLKVKARLNVPANSLAGTYQHTALDNTGLFVTVNYN